MEFRNIRAVIVDIEGTTSSIAFAAGGPGAIGY
jgi:hypothetical protein